MIMDAIQEAYDWIFETSDEPEYSLALSLLQKIPRTFHLQNQLLWAESLTKDPRIPIEVAEQFWRDFQRDFRQFISDSKKEISNAKH